MQTAPQPQIKADNAALFIGDSWQAFLPALPADQPLQGRDMVTALQQAQTVIRAQEDRIRTLESLTLTDELTGLINRRGFVRAFERELAMARRDAAKGGLLVMLDLDGFKAINDRWGHPVGDAYLRAVAEALQEGVRASDVVARLGGDEFALLLTNIGAESAAARLARLEMFFHKRSLLNRQPIPLRASFGCAPYHGGLSAEFVMAAADARLYNHKAEHKQVLTAVDG